MNNVELAKKVWGSLKGSSAKAKKFQDLVAVSFSLISEDNEDIFVVVRDGALMVEPYHYDDNNCEVEASAETIDKMFSGEISFDKALSEGSAQVKSGDPAKLKALECLVPTKKAAAKPAEKKAPVAKAPAKEAPKAAEKPVAKEVAKPADKPATAPAPAAKKAPAPKKGKKK